MAKKIEIDYEKEVQRSFDRWNEIAKNGAGDPFWPDGTNMNLVRNHIIYFYRKMDEEGGQLTMFECSEENRRPIPPKVPNGYLVIGGKHGKYAETDRDIVWGHSGEYKA